MESIQTGRQRHDWKQVAASWSSVNAEERWVMAVCAQCGREACAHYVMPDVYVADAQTWFGACPARLRDDNEAVLSRTDGNPAIQEVDLRNERLEDEHEEAK